MRTPLILLPFLLAACSGADVPEAIDEADSVIIVSEQAAETDVLGDAYLNPERDPEGNNIMGEPGGAAEGAGNDSTHDTPGTTEDNMDVINEDAEPED